MKADCSYLICKNLFLSFIPMLLQITDDNYVEFLAGWQIENKPNVLLFDQVPQVPLIYKVSNLSKQTADAQIRLFAYKVGSLRLQYHIYCIRVFECTVLF